GGKGGRGGGAASRGGGIAAAAASTARNSRRVGMCAAHDSIFRVSSGAVTDPFRAYRPWFWAAIVYNVTWGISVVLYPRWLLWSADLGEASAPLAQAVG